MPDTLREKVAMFVIQAIDGKRGSASAVAAIMQAVEEDRAALADALRHVKAHAHMAPETERIVVEALAGVKEGKK